MHKNAKKIIESEYRMIKSTWGIAINIEAKFDLIKLENQADIILIFLPAVHLNDEEKNLINLGIKKVEKQIISINPLNKIQITISSVAFNPSDYQKEGLEPAIIKWASVAFEFPPPQILVNYNKDRRRYEFNYDNA